MARLKEFAPLDSTGTSPLLQWRDELKKYLSDFDPNVASAAADILGIINGTRPDPTPTRRPPQQPTELELRTLPTRRDDVLRGRQPDLHDSSQETTRR